MHKARLQQQFRTVLFRFKLQRFYLIALEVFFQHFGDQGNVFFGEGTNIAHHVDVVDGYDVFGGTVGD